MTTPGIGRHFRTVRVTSLVAGTDWEVAPGGQRWWRVISFAATLTTSAAVPVRRPRFEALAGERVWVRLPVAADQAASLTVVYTGHTAVTRAGIVDGTQVVELPSAGLLVAPGDRFRVITAAIDAGDQWSAITLRVEEIPKSRIELHGDQLTQPSSE